MSGDSLHGLEGARRRLEEMKRRREEHKHTADVSPNLHSPTLVKAAPVVRKSSSSSSDEVMVSMLKQEIESLKLTVTSQKETILQQLAQLQSQEATIATLKTDNTELRFLKMELDERIMQLEDELFAASTNGHPLEAAGEEDLVSSSPAPETQVKEVQKTVAESNEPTSFDVDRTENLSTVEFTDVSNYHQQLSEMHSAALTPTLNTAQSDLLDQLESAQSPPRLDSENSNISDVGHVEELEVKSQSEVLITDKQLTDDAIDSLAATEPKAKEFTTEESEVKELETDEPTDELKTVEILPEVSKDEEIKTEEPKSVEAVSKESGNEEIETEQNTSSNLNTEEPEVASTETRQSQEAQREKLLELFLDDALLDNELLDDELLDSEEIDEQNPSAHDASADHENTVQEDESLETDNESIKEVVSLHPIIGDQVQYEAPAFEEKRSEPDVLESITVENLSSPEDKEITDLSRPSTLVESEALVEDSEHEDSEALDFLQEEKTKTWVPDEDLEILDEPDVSEALELDSNTSVVVNGVGSDILQDIETNEEVIAPQDLDSLPSAEPLLVENRIIEAPNVGTQMTAIDADNTLEEGENIIDDSGKQHERELDSEIEQKVTEQEGDRGIDFNDELEEITISVKATNENQESGEKESGLPSSKEYTPFWDDQKNESSEKPIADSSHENDTEIVDAADEAGPFVEQKSNDGKDAIFESDFLKSLKAAEPEPRDVSGQLLNQGPYDPFDHAYHGAEDVHYSPYESQVYEDTHYFEESKQQTGDEATADTNSAVDTTTQQTNEPEIALNKLNGHNDTHLEELVSEVPEVSVPKAEEFKDEESAEVTVENPLDVPVTETASEKTENPINESSADEGSLKEDSINEILATDPVGEEDIKSPTKPTFSHIGEEFISDNIDSTEASSKTDEPPKIPANVETQVIPDSISTTPASSPDFASIRSKPIATPVLSPPPPIRSPERPVRPPITVNEYLPSGSVDFPKTSDFRENLKRWQGWQVDMVNWNISSARAAL